MAIVSSDYSEDNLTEVLAGAENITGANLLDSFKYLAKLVANIGKKTLEESGNHQVLIQQLQVKFQEMEGAADRAVQNACLREIAESIKDMKRGPIKKGVMEYKSVEGIPKLKERNEYKSWNDRLVNGMAQIHKERRNAMKYLMKVASRGIMVDNKFKYDNDAESSLYENGGISTPNDFAYRVA